MTRDFCSSYVLNQVATYRDYPYRRFFLTLIAAIAEHKKLRGGRYWYFYGLRGLHSTSL
jgi:hypothetical protein